MFSSCIVLILRIILNNVEHFVYRVNMTLMHAIHVFKYINYYNNFHYNYYIDLKNTLFLNWLFLVHYSYVELYHQQYPPLLLPLTESIVTGYSPAPMTE